MNLVTMNSKEFFGDFSKKFNPKDYQYIIISRDIESNGSKKSVITMPELVPPVATVMNKFIEKGRYCKSYEKAYANYLDEPAVRFLLAVIAKSVIDEGQNIVLLCSSRESEYKYLEMIAKTLNQLYGVIPMTCKELVNGKRAYDRTGLAKEISVKAITNDLRMYRHYTTNKTRKARFVSIEAALQELSRDELQSMVLFREYSDKDSVRAMKKKKLIKLLLKGKKKRDKKIPIVLSDRGGFQDEYNYKRNSKFPDNYDRIQSSWRQ